MRLTLVLTGKVQVDIRLLVSLESQERLETEYQIRPCDQLFCRRPDISYPAYRHPALAGKGLDLRRLSKSTVIAVCCSDNVRSSGLTSVIPDMVAAKEASYRTTGAYQISILVRLPYQFLCNDVHYGKSVRNNGVQFTSPVAASTI